MLPTKKSRAFSHTVLFVAFLMSLVVSCAQSGRSTGSTEKAQVDRQFITGVSSKETWSLNNDSKPQMRMADWVDYLQLPFDPNLGSGLFAAVDTNVISYDYGLYNPALGGGHIARAAQHALTYGNYVVGRECLEKAIADYMTANNITMYPDKYFYQQGFWPMRKANILSTDPLVTKVSKALKSLHGGDLVYSKIVSNGPENGAEVVTLNCTVCHESRALVPTSTAGKFKAVRQPWGSEGYISKNMKLMGKAVQDAVAKAAGGDSCASGPNKYIFAALYEIQRSKHNSVGPNGASQYVDMDPRRLLTLTPESSFYNPAGQVAHSAVNMIINRGSWYNGKPSTVDEAYRMFDPEDVLSNAKFFPILNANFNILFGTNRTGAAAPVNFSLNSGWSQKFYTPTDNLFHGMGCTYRDKFGQVHLAACDVNEKATLLAAATNSQAENPTLSNETLGYFPGVPYDYKWPLRRYSGENGVFERTRELFIGLDSNLGNPQIADIVSKRAMTYETIDSGLALYNVRCATCHGTAGMGPSDVTNVFNLNPGVTDVVTRIDTTRDMPARAYIENLRAQQYVQEDAVRDLTIKEFDGYRGNIYYGELPGPNKLAIKNLVGIALEQRFGCNLDLDEFLQRKAQAAIQVTSSVMEISTTLFRYKKDFTWATHTAANETAALAKDRHRIFWAKEHTECGPLSTTGATVPANYYDQPFHGDRLSGSNPSYPLLTATQRKNLIDFFIAISFDKTVVTKAGTQVTLRLQRPSRNDVMQMHLVTDGAECKKTCAKPGDPCDVMTERAWAFQSGTNKPTRFCCSEIDDPASSVYTQTATCKQNPTGGYAWRFQDYAGDCSSLRGRGQDMVGPAGKCRARCTASTQLNPDESCSSEGTIEITKIPGGQWQVNSQFSCVTNPVCPGGMTCDPDTKVCIYPDPSGSPVPTTPPLQLTNDYCSSSDQCPNGTICNIDQRCGIPLCQNGACPNDMYGNALTCGSDNLCYMPAPSPSPATKFYTGNSCMGGDPCNSGELCDVSGSCYIPLCPIGVACPSGFSCGTNERCTLNVTASPSPSPSPSPTVQCPSSTSCNYSLCSDPAYYSCSAFQGNCCT